MKSTYKLVVVALISVVLSACAAGGATFTQKQQTASSGHGQVVFYRAKNLANAVALTWLQDNGETIGRLKNGQFITHTVKPGTHQFSTKSAAIDRPVEIDVKAGKTYYVEATQRIGVWVGSWELKRIYEKDALAALQTCCKSG